MLLTHVAFASSAARSSWYDLLVHLDAGVAVFFVVAGFLLFRPYVAQHVDGAPAPSFGRYLFRRGLRILPGYWVALSVLALAGLISLGTKWWEHYTLTQIYDPAQWLAGIHAAWSLAVELSFYLALPVIVLLLRGEPAPTRAGRVRSAAALVACLWAGGIAFRLIFRVLDQSLVSIWFKTLPGMIDWFALGMGLAVVSVVLSGSARRPSLIRLLENRPGLSWAGAAAVYVFACVGLGASGRWGATHTELGWFFMHELYGLVALLIVAPAVFSGDGRRPVHRILGCRVAAGLGLISYGIFLYNGPFVTWDTRWGVLQGDPFFGVLFVTLELTIIAAALSYWFIERPVLWLKDARLGFGLPRRRSRLRETETPAA